VFRLLHHSPLLGENLTSSFEMLKIENIFLENLWVQAQTLKRGPTSVGSSRVIVQARGGLWLLCTEWTADMGLYGGWADSEGGQ
jgi:hypothetical protein